ncbi:MAG TPA: cytochrome c oxidase subunit II [Chitinophagaceae bacterium]|nr:cytochrome c oxidase subunit II [Chitinophagaceae bacterium]
MSTLFLIAILALGFLIVFQIAKASEYVAVLKGEKKTFEQNNRINAFMMIVFLVGGLIGVWVCNEALKGKILKDAASDHGVKIDNMLYITLAITGVVFVITQVLLFWFSYKYQYSEKRKAYYYPHNNKLELIWTVVPAIFLTVLVGFGLYYWFKITGEAPANALKVEITGRQFAWIARYEGKDKTFGKKYFRNINDENKNQLGLVWDDPATHDDIVVDGTDIYIVKDRPVKMIINSRDVVHDVGLSHFRMKMDAVPGTPTTMWFTPLYTTEEMRKKLNNPEFEYELSCDQMCGDAHYTMKGIIRVVTQQEFDLWLAGRTPNYVSYQNAINPKPAGANAADSAGAVNKPTAAVTAPATSNNQ